MKETDFPKGFVVSIKPDFSFIKSRFANKIKAAYQLPTVIAVGLNFEATKTEIRRLKTIYPQNRIKITYVDEYGEFSRLDWSVMLREDVTH